MPLSSMVVSRDWQETSVLECILGSLQIDVMIEQEPQRAMSRLSKSKVDTLIVDCDLHGSAQLLRELPGLARTANAFALVLMGASGNVGDLEQTGASFAFEKPISVEQAITTLSAARNLIVDRRVQRPRAGVQLPVGVSIKGQKTAEAQSLDLSQGGMRIRAESALDVASRIEICVALPGENAELKAEAEVVWKDQSGNFGIRFLKVPQQQKRRLQLWLAQQLLEN
jgi:hypothetical protein